MKGNKVDLDIDIDEDDINAEISSKWFSGKIRYAFSEKQKKIIKYLTTALAVYAVLQQSGILDGLI